MANRDQPGADPALASSPSHTRPAFISQRLNVCYRDVRLAVRNRQASVVVNLAREQHESGADYLDLCAAGLPNECDSLAWMVQAVQQEVDCALALDSADAGTLLRSFDQCIRPPILNAMSVSLLRAGTAHDLMSLPARAFIISAYDPETSNTPADRIDTLREVLGEIASRSSSTFIADPLFYPQRFDAHRWEESCEAARGVRNAWPEAGLLCAVGNVTFRSVHHDWTNTHVTNKALAEGFDWILCDLARVAPKAAGHSR